MKHQLQPRGHEHSSSEKKDQYDKSGCCRRGSCGSVLNRLLKCRGCMCLNISKVNRCDTGYLSKRFGLAGEHQFILTHCTF